MEVIHQHEIDGLRLRTDRVVQAARSDCPPDIVALAEQLREIVFVDFPARGPRKVIASDLIDLRSVIRRLQSRVMRELGEHSEFNDLCRALRQFAFFQLPDPHSFFESEDEREEEEDEEKAVESESEKGEASESEEDEDPVHDYESIYDEEDYEVIDEDETIDEWDG